MSTASTNPRSVQELPPSMAMQGQMATNFLGLHPETRVTIDRQVNGHAIPPSTAPAPLNLKEFFALDCGAGQDVSPWSPAQALRERLDGRIGADAGRPTLRDYLCRPGFMCDEPHSLVNTHLSELPKPDALLVVYGLCFQNEETETTRCAVVMPGASVAISKDLARMMVPADEGHSFELVTTTVYPDELVYQGAPYAFIYVPRSLELGFERYQADYQRAQNRVRRQTQVSLCESAETPVGS